VAWSPPPTRTPIASTLTTDDGLERTLETDWLHVDAGEQWAFLKIAERQVEPSAAAPYLETTYTRNAGAPYELLELDQCDASGACRGRTFRYVGSPDGQATSITDAAGQTTTYSYYEDYGGYRPRTQLNDGMLLPEGRVGCVSCHRGYDRQHGELVVAREQLCYECHDL